jgi:hypothetical protein
MRGAVRNGGVCWLIRVNSWLADGVRGGAAAYIQDTKSAQRKPICGRNHQRMHTTLFSYASVSRVEPVLYLGYGMVGTRDKVSVRLLCLALNVTLHDSMSALCGSGTQSTSHVSEGVASQVSSTAWESAQMSIPSCLARTTWWGRGAISSL